MGTGAGGMTTRGAVWGAAAPVEGADAEADAEAGAEAAAAVDDVPLSLAAATAAGGRGALGFVAVDAVGAGGCNGAATGARAGMLPGSGSGTPAGASAVGAATVAGAAGTSGVPGRRSMASAAATTSTAAPPAIQRVGDGFTGGAANTSTDETAGGASVGPAGLGVAGPRGAAGATSGASSCRVKGATVSLLTDWLGERVPPPSRVWDVSTIAAVSAARLSTRSCTSGGVSSGSVGRRKTALRRASAMSCALGKRSSFR